MPPRTRAPCPRGVNLPTRIAILAPKEPAGRWRPGTVLMDEDRALWARTGRPGDEDSDSLPMRTRAPWGEDHAPGGSDGDPWGQDRGPVGEEPAHGRCGERLLVHADQSLGARTGLLGVRIGLPVGSGSRSRQQGSRALAIACRPRRLGAQPRQLRRAARRARQERRAGERPGAECHRSPPQGDVGAPRSRRVVGSRRRHVQALSRRRDWRQGSTWTSRSSRTSRCTASSGGTGPARRCCWRRWGGRCCRRHTMFAGRPTSGTAERTGTRPSFAGCYWDEDVYERLKEIRFRMPTEPWLDEVAIKTAGED